MKIFEDATKCYWVILSIKLAPCEPKVISCGRSTQLFQEVKRSQKLRIFLAWSVLPLESMRVLCVCNGRKITSSYLKHHHTLFWEREGFTFFIIFLFWPGLSSFMINNWVEAEAVEKGQQALEAFRGSGNKDAAADAVRLVDSSVSWNFLEVLRSYAKLVRFYWDICVSQMSQSSQRSWRASWVENSILEHKIWQKRSLPSFERCGSATIRRSVRLITNILQSYTVLYCQYVRSMKNRSHREHDSSVHLNFTLIINLKFFSSL